MSQRQTLAIVQALLEDESLGLRATVERLAATLPNAPTGDPGPLSADFAFYRGALPGVMRPATSANVMLRPVRWVTNPRLGGNVREGVASIDVGFEMTSASLGDRVDEVALVATALVQCLDGLRDYSDAHAATYGSVIVDVNPGIDFSFADFEGPNTYGFLARFSVQELSKHD